MDRTLNNADLEPVDSSGRTWNLWHIASLWVGMSVCIPSYMLASSMISAGLGWRTPHQLLGSARRRRAACLCATT